MVMVKGRHGYGKGSSWLWVEGPGHHGYGKRSS